MRNNAQAWFLIGNYCLSSKKYKQYLKNKFNKVSKKCSPLFYGGRRGCVERVIRRSKQ